MLDRQIGWLGALQNLSGVNANQAKGSYEVQSIADQAASFDELARLVDRRNAAGCRQRRELLAPVGKEWVAADDERAGMQLDEGCEGGVDLAFGAGGQDMELYPLCAPLPACL